MFSLEGRRDSDMLLLFYHSASSNNTMLCYVASEKCKFIRSHLWFSNFFFSFRRDTNFSCVENQRRLRSTINTRGLSAIRGSMDTLLHIFPRRRLLITSERLCVIKCHVNTALPCDNKDGGGVLVPSRLLEDFHCSVDWERHQYAADIWRERIFSLPLRCAYIRTARVYEHDFLFIVNFNFSLFVPDLMQHFLLRRVHRGFSLRAPTETLQAQRNSRESSSESFA